jgi:hypothetical protein
LIGADAVVAGAVERQRCQRHHGSHEYHRILPMLPAQSNSPFEEIRRRLCLEKILE